MSLLVQERISQLVAEIEVEKDHDRLTKLAQELNDLLNSQPQTVAATSPAEKQKQYQESTKIEQEPG